MVGFVVGSFVKVQYIGLLGFIPVIIGLKKYAEFCLPGEEDKAPPDPAKVHVDETSPGGGQAALGDVEMASSPPSVSPQSTCLPCMLGMAYRPLSLGFAKTSYLGWRHGRVT
jgi:hypothetical protein